MQFADMGFDSRASVDHPSCQKLTPRLIPEADKKPWSQSYIGLCKVHQITLRAEKKIKILPARAVTKIPLRIN